MARKRTTSLAVTLSGPLPQPLVGATAPAAPRVPAQPSRPDLGKFLTRELEGTGQIIRDLIWASSMLGDLTREALGKGATLQQIADISGLPVECHQDALVAS